MRCNSRKAKAIRFNTRQRCLATMARFAVMFCRRGQETSAIAAFIQTRAGSFTRHEKTAGRLRRIRLCDGGARREDDILMRGKPLQTKSGRLSFSRRGAGVAEQG